MRFLRAFRDEILLKSRYGRAFSRTYYRVSPIPAALVESHPLLKRGARRMLDTIVEKIESRTHLRREGFRSTPPHRH